MRVFVLACLLTLGLGFHLPSILSNGTTSNSIHFHKNIRNPLQSLVTLLVALDSATSSSQFGSQTRAGRSQASELTSSRADRLTETLSAGVCNLLEAVTSRARFRRDWHGGNVNHFNSDGRKYALVQYSGTAFARNIARTKVPVSVSLIFATDQGPKGAEGKNGEHIVESIEEVSPSGMTYWNDRDTQKMIADALKPCSQGKAHLHRRFLVPGQLAGYMLSAKGSDTSNVVVQGIEVHPDHQRRGLGKLLFTKHLNFVKSLGMISDSPSLTFQVGDSKAATKFWENIVGHSLSPLQTLERARVSTAALEENPKQKHNGLVY